MSAVRTLAAAAALLVLSGCSPGVREEIDTLSQLGDGDTLVVGRVELVPPLLKGEQRIKALNSGHYENKIFILADERDRVLPPEPRIFGFAGRIDAVLGSTFFVRSSAKPFYILAGVMFLDLGGKEYNKAYFPGGLRASLQPGDKAVYIGTLQYHRNEFFEISKVVVGDDYERANAEFKNKFGAKIPLRKALLTRAQER
jgi:hypothetical protein